MKNLGKKTIPEETMDDILKKHFGSLENEILFHEKTVGEKETLLARIARYGLFAVTWITIGVWLLYEILY